MYDRRLNLQLGFHGCDESVRDKLINDPDTIEISSAPYDWLGHGFYVWENNHTRALNFARDKQKRSGIENPSVVGVIYDLGECLDFTDQKFTDMISTAYDLMVIAYQQKNLIIPENRTLKMDSHNDYLLRDLDCSVIQFLHELTEAVSPPQGLKSFDSVRGVFWEGGPAYPGAGIYKKAHIQICIKNLNCIKGFFKVRQ